MSGFAAAKTTPMDALEAAATTNGSDGPTLPSLLAAQPSLRVASVAVATTSGFANYHDVQDDDRFKLSWKIIFLSS